MLARLLAAVLVLASGAALAVLAWPQAIGAEQWPFVAQAVSFRAAAALAAVAAVVALGVLSMFWRSGRAFLSGLALMATLFAVASAAVVVVRGPFGLPMPSATPEDVTVVAWNTFGESVAPEDVAALVVDSDADVVSLPESGAAYGDEIVALLAAEGIGMQRFTVAYDEVAKANSTTLLVSDELGAYRTDEATTTAHRPSIVATPIDGVGPTLVAVHTTAPITELTDDWSADLAWVSALCDGREVIVAGDLNSTIDHWWSLADRSVTGADLGACRDAADERQSAGVGTWPTSVPALTGTPIDHVLVGGAWTVRGFEVVDDADATGSDHRPVVARLASGDASE